MIDELHSPVIDELHSFQPIDYRQSVGSTQDEMRILARAGAPEYSLVLSETQTAGRGRRGKVWQAAPYSGLYFTLLLRPDLNFAAFALLPLLIGACVAKSINLETGISTMLKWSNDILSADARKFAGILLESELSQKKRIALVGIGINVRNQDFPAEFKAAALEEFAPVHRRNLLTQILQTIQAEYPLFLEQPSHAITFWKAQPNFLGQAVQILEPNGTVSTGIAQDLDSSGGLIIQTATGSRLLYAGEVSLKRG